MDDSYILGEGVAAENEDSSPFRLSTTTDRNRFSNWKLSPQNQKPASFLNQKFEEVEVQIKRPVKYLPPISSKRVTLLPPLPPRTFGKHEIKEAQTKRTAVSAHYKKFITADVKAGEEGRPYFQMQDYQLSAE